MTAPFVISMKMTADSAGAVSSAGKVREELGRLGQALDTSRLKAVELQGALTTKASATSSTDAYRATLDQIRAEQQLEAQRLSAQITETGRMQSINRLAQLAREAAASSQALARAEAESAAAQQRVSQTASAAASAVARLADQQQRVAALRAAGINNALGVRDDFGTEARAADIAAYGAELDTLRARFNPLFAAQQRHAAVVGEITRAHRLGAISADEMAAALMRERAALDATAASLGHHNAAAAQMAGPSAGRFETANIAAQFQDVAVTSAMGMNPLMIGLQQGTQLAAVLNTMQNPVKGLAAAMMSVVNPVSLLTIGFVSLTAAGVQWLASMAGESDDAESALERHSAWLDEILVGYEAARQAAQEVVEEAQRLPSGVVEREILSGMEERAASISQAVTQLAHWREVLENFTGQAQAGLRSHEARAPGDTDVIERYEELIGLARELASIDIGMDSTAEEIDAALTSLSLLRDTASDGTIRRLAGDAYDLASQIRGATAETESLGAALRQITLEQTFAALGASISAPVQSALDRINAAIPDLLSTRERIASEFQSGLVAAVNPTEIETLTVAYERFTAAMDEQDRREKARQDEREAERLARQVSEYDRLIASTRDRTVAMDIETAAIGLGTFAAAQLTKTLELEAAARKDAIGLSPQRISQIHEEATAYALVAERQEELLEVQRRAEEEMEFYRGTFRGLFTDLTGGLREGLPLWDAFGQAGANAFDRIADRALSMAADGIFDMLFGPPPSGIGGGGGGLLGGLLSGLFGFRGFDVGGWTGGTRGQVRGLVHGEEFVVRAGPASQHRALLETINAGGAPAAGMQAVLAPVYNYNGSGFTEAQARRLMSENNRQLMDMLPGALADAHRRAVRGTG